MSNSNINPEIKVAIVGVGNCASSLIQGVELYAENPDYATGLMYQEIGGYSAKHLKFVAGFDIDERKVNRPLREAIFEAPNCSMIRFKPEEITRCVAPEAEVYPGPQLDGIAPHMWELPDEVTFKPMTRSLLSIEKEAEIYQHTLKKLEVDVLLNFLPVGSEEASKFYIENAIKAGVHVVNCMPTFISTEETRELERLAVRNQVTIIGSDMRSSFGASRLSEIIQGSMLDAGLNVTQHIQMNMAAGTTQGDENVQTGRTANTDFLNMYAGDRLQNKWISKENVLKGQSQVRDKSIAGTTMFAGPSLTVFQRPGGQYVGSDNKVCNIDMVAYGWMGARYELTARLSVQDSPNSAGIVFDAIRFCKVASEIGIIGYLRGPSAYSQKTPPVHLSTADAKFECDALARRVLTHQTETQLKARYLSLVEAHGEESGEACRIFTDSLKFTFQSSDNDYSL